MQETFMTIYVLYCSESLGSVFNFLVFTDDPWIPQLRSSVLDICKKVSTFRLGGLNGENSVEDLKKKNAGVVSQMIPVYFIISMKITII